MKNVLLQHAIFKGSERRKRVSKFKGEEVGGWEVREATEEG